MPEKIVEKELVDQYVEDMQRYSIYVTRKRSTPSGLDGLKPVQRRIIYDMFAIEHCNSYGAKVKSAAIVGSTMKNYHPHGDTSIYDTMKPLTNWFECKMPLINPKGNFGTIQGNGASAYRYTEAYLSQFGIDCVVGDLQENKQAVDWVDNYDGSCKEPEFLPVRVPLLLINGSMGIGVGMRADISTHNLSEVIDETIKLIYDPNYTPILIPDHCMKCTIEDADWKSISENGFGSYRIRGIIENGTFDGKPALIIKSTPNLTFLNTITDKIEALIDGNKIVQIQACYDKSTAKDMNYIIVLKKGADPDFVKEVIYKNTDMEKSVRINFEVLDGITPVRMSYKRYLQTFIEFRKTTKFRVYCNELQRIQTKYHEREAFVKLLESGEVDNVIQMIKKQTDVEDNHMTEYLVSKLKITDMQARYILTSDLRKLAAGHLSRYKAEMLELENARQSMMNKVVDDGIILQEIINELQDIKKKYGTPRLCKVVKNFTQSEVPSGTFKIAITDNNYIKKIPMNDPINSFKGASIKQVITADNTENILLFDEMGKVFKLPVHKIPFSEKGTNGYDIRMMVKGLTCNIATIMYEPIIQQLSDRFHGNAYMTMVTSKGYTKRMDLADFLAVTPSGLLYSKVDPGDHVKSVIIIGGKTDVVIYSDRKAVRMTCDMIPYLKRNTRGSKCMNSDLDIDGLSIIKPDTTDIIVITESGKVNKFGIVAMPYPKTKAGTNVIKLGKTDKIMGIYGVNSSCDMLRLTTKKGKIDVKISDIVDGSSIGPGVKLPGIERVFKCDIYRVDN